MTNILLKMTNTMPNIMNDLPQTIGAMLDKRRVVEKRLDASSHITCGEQDFKFWSNNKDSVKDASSQLQSLLDRYAVLAELNELQKAVGVLKYTHVIVPRFVTSMSNVTLTLAQLRDIQTWMMPLTTSLEQHLTNQATDVSKLISAHDNSVRAALQAEQTELRSEYNKKVKKAEALKEPVPTDEHLNSELDLAQRRADDKKAIRVDSVAVKDVITGLRTFNDYINAELNTMIDSCNSTNVSAEITKFNEMREYARVRLLAGESCISDPKESAETDTMSLADLGLRTDELYRKILNAIPKLQVVTFKRGKTANHEHNVSDASRSLAEVCKNILTLMAYRQAHHRGMSLEFTAIHPLTKQPLSVDGLVRLGYMADTENPKLDENNNVTYNKTTNKTLRKNKNTGKTCQGNTHTSLRMGLHNMMTKLASVEGEVSSDKANHEAVVKESISIKQEARAKSGATMKAGELDDIAKSVTTANAKEWYVAEHLYETLEKVKNLVETVDSLQSAQRKSANANIMVSVPKVFPMRWADSNDDLDGW